MGRRLSEGMGTPASLKGVRYPVLLMRWRNMSGSGIYAAVLRVDDARLVVSDTSLGDRRCWASAGEGFVMSGVEGIVDGGQGHGVDRMD